VEALHQLHQAQPHLQQGKALADALAPAGAKRKVGGRVLGREVLMALVVVVVVVVVVVRGREARRA
jgi:t-SNARE complex subunit (syntaxin)